MSLCFYAFLWSLLISNQLITLQTQYSYKPHQNFMANSAHIYEYSILKKNFLDNFRISLNFSKLF